MRQQTDTTLNRYRDRDIKMSNREEFEEALRECANECIHEIGHIQPHGFVLVFEADGAHVVRQGSENLAQVFDLRDAPAVGQPLEALLGQPGTEQALALIELAQTKLTPTGVIEVMHRGVPIQMQAHLYAAGVDWALELEYDDGIHQEAQLAQLQLQFQKNLLEFDSDADLPRYLNEIAKLVRTLTGYDSVMVYRFSERWDGEIIAQDRAEVAPSYLGMHFPASDIPPQARRLYGLNLVRIVADVNAQPVPILPVMNAQTGKPLDMTYSALRSLSPIHMTYLRNIGVAASMVISLIQDGKLWGLVACHHMTPKRVSIAMREAAVFISRMISAKLSGIAALEHRAKVDQANSLVSELVKSIATDDESDTMSKLMPRLTQVVDATGVIVLVDGRTHEYGDVPDAAEVRNLLDWLGKGLPVAEVFATDELALHIPSAQSYASVASGVLTTALSLDMRSGIVWLRKEKRRTVNWGGKYQSGLVQNDAGDFRLTPRKSFEIWCETWQGRSEPWSAADIGIAAMLSLSVPEALNQKHNLEVEQARFRQAHLVSESTVRQFNQLTGAIPGVVYQFLVKPDGTWEYLYLSAYLHKLFEVSPEDAYRDHNVLTGCIVAEHRDSHRTSIQHACRTLKPWVHEHLIQIGSGARKWVRGQALPEEQGDGSVLWHGILTDITADKQAQDRLRQSEERWQFAIEGTGDGLWDWNLQSGEAYFSPRYKSMLGYSEAEFSSNSDEWLKRVHPEDVVGVLTALRPYFDGQPGSATVEYRMLRKDGHWQWTLGRGHVVSRDADGKPLRMIGTNTDITERKRADETLRLTASVFAHAREGIIVTDVQGRILDINAAFSRITGYSRQDVLGQNPRILQSGRQDKAFYLAMWSDLSGQGYWEGEIWNRRKDGEVFPERLAIAAVRDAQGKTQQYVAIFSDISERKRLEEDVHQLAFFDPLTKLPNRRMLNDRLGQAMAASKRSGRHAALMILDLDNFKPLNDRHGHIVGDLLLVEVARRLSACVREVDTVARFGGDEFVVMLSDLGEDKGESRKHAELIAEKIRLTLAEPYVLNFQGNGRKRASVEHRCSASIGLVVFINNELAQEEVFQWADAAMYQAKGDGRNAIRFYEAAGKV